MTTTTNPTEGRAHKAAKRYIYAWGDGRAEGDATMRDLLGGKGAGLAEMTNAGLPVPPGFTITTEACNDYFTAGERLPDGLWDDVLAAVKEVEALTGKGFGDAADPLLVSVRSGAKFSMPGMMDTVLNLGLNEETLHGLIALTGNERFGWDAYRRFIQMFGRIVMDVKGERFDEHSRRPSTPAASSRTPTSTPTTCRPSSTSSRGSSATTPGATSRATRTSSSTSRSRPSSPAGSASAPIDYRNNQKIAHDLGTAVNVVTMVFGNMGDDSGTASRSPATRTPARRSLFGEYLTNAQGEDVVAGIRTAPKIAQMQTDMPEVYAEFQRIGEQLERHYRDVQDLEFTIERGKLYMLQTRSAKRTAAAAVKIATDLVNEGVITKDEALGRIEPAHVDQLLRDQFDPAARSRAQSGSSRASTPRPGAAVGRAVFDADTAVEWVDRGEKVVLVRIETSPDDFHGMAVAEGIITARGGATSPRRGRRPPDRQAVRGRIGASSSSTTARSRPHCDRDRHRLQGGRLGQPRWRRPATCISARCPTVSARFEDQPELQTILGWADEVRRMQVWTNADKPEEAALARSYGAQGIGLCRTEHMFREGERLEIVRGAILVANVATRAKAKAAAGETLDADEADGGQRRSTPRWPSSRSSSRATSRASSGRWTACRSSSG